MKQFVIILFFTFAATIAKSQSFPAIVDSPTWKIGMWDFWSGGCTSFNWKYGNSISICANQYMEVIECDFANTNCTVMGYIRIDSQKVFVRKTTLCTETDKLMYDFSLLSPSTYQAAYNLGTYDSTIAQVVSTQNIIYQSVSRFTQTVNYFIDPPANLYFDSLKTIEGIGSDVHPFYPLICLGDFCERNYQLMEYKKGAQLLYSKTPVFPLPCNSWTGMDENQNNVAVTIYPNPFTDEIMITTSQNESAEIILYDIISRKIVLQNFSNKISVNAKQLEKGVYIYELRNKKGLFHKGKIVKE